MPRKFRDAVAALHDLLDSAERRPGGVRYQVSPDYDAMTSTSELETFHGMIAKAEAAHAVEVRRRRHEGPANIHLIALSDAARLAAFLRRDPAADAAAQAIKELRSRLGPQAGWIETVIDEIGSGWTLRREPFPGLMPCDVGLTEKFLRILAAIDREEHLRGWDMRRFSTHACRDSKAVEAAAARLARVLRRRFDIPDVKPLEVLAALGIEKFSLPVLIRGRIRLSDGTELTARHYYGLPPEIAPDITVLGTVPYVLVIENLASFNRYAREIKDDGVVIYSGGFPSRATLAVVRRLDASLPQAVAFFHWGDTDPHGHLILEHIRSAIRRPLTPHLMDRADGGEQEAIDPEPPPGPQEAAGCREPSAREREPSVVASPIPP